MIVDAFIDVKEKTIAPVSQYQKSILSEVNSLQVGNGSQVLRVDESGLWLGGKKFVDAPFSVDMEGNVTATTLNLSAYLTKADTGQTLTGDVSVGAGNVKSFRVVTPLQR